MSRQTTVTRGRMRACDHASEAVDADDGSARCGCGRWRRLHAAEMAAAEQAREEAEEAFAAIHAEWLAERRAQGRS